MTTTPDARRAEIVAQAADFAKKAHPGIAAGQLSRLTAAVADMSFCETYLSAGWSRPEPREIEWHVGHAVKLDADLARGVPTPQEVADHMMAEAKAAGRNVGAAERMSFFRAAQEMDADQRLAAVPAAAEALKDKAPSDTSVKKEATTMPPAYDPADANSLVRAFCESQESTYKEMLREHGPGRLTAMAQAWHEQGQRKPFTADTPAPVQARRNPAGKAAADAWAASPEARAMSAPARMSRYRELLAQE